MSPPEAVSPSLHDCAHCSQRFASKNKLFAHLRSSACTAAAVASGLTISAVHEKIALLIGCTCVEETWQTTLWRAVDIARGADRVDGRMQYAKCGGAPGAAFASSPRDADVLSLEPGALRICDVLSFTTEAVGSEEERREWCARANAALPPDIRILGRSVGLSADFQADLSCLRRCYECVVPMSLLLPGDSLEWGPSSKREPQPAPPPSSARHPAPSGDAEAEGHAKDEHDPGWGDGTVGEPLLGQFLRLKQTLRKLHGQHSFHNFATPAKLVPSEASARRTVLKVRAKTAIGQGMVTLAVAADALLVGQLRVLAGLIIAMQKGLLPEDSLRDALSEEMLITLPAVPRGSVCFTGCVYSKQYHPHLQPLMDGPAAEAWRLQAQRTLLERFPTDAFRRWFRSELAAAVPAVLACKGRARAAEGAVRTGGLPEAYREVLRLLREASDSGRWPGVSPGRAKVIKGSTLSENGGAGGSLSVGSMPPPLQAPTGNRLFPELAARAFELERLLLPARPPSSTIAINKHAQFLPHVDSGAGAGQGVSLIVGLGDYTGGSLIVEGVEHDIRYKPVEFNGWTQRHWTMPFNGERFTLVWFTPLGCEGQPGLEL